jgi:hypothetical protein
MSSKPDVVIGFCHPAQWEAGFGRSLLSLVMRDKGRRVLDVIPSESSSFLVAGRNEVVRLFLQTRGQWLLQVDADMVLPHDLIPRLLRHATPNRIVGGLCFTATDLPVMFGAEGTRITSWTPGALVPVLATGGACLMIHRSVFERFPPGVPWFAMDASMYQMDQDQCFLRACRILGVDVAVDTSTVIGHIKQRVIDGSTYVNPGAQSAQ